MSKILAFILFLLSLLLYPIIFVLIKFSSKGSFIYKQKRLGKDKKVFVIYKFRTMVDNAEKLKKKYISLNEAKGPTFKIKNDPRYTSVGKLLARMSLDELPQLLNIVKGDMAFVGPRPLPIEEALKIPEKYNKRFAALPGLTSPWVIEGGHRMSFNQWMTLDCNYAKNKNVLLDLYIIYKTIVMLMRSYL